MPVHRHDGSSFIQHFARMNSGSFSDENDNMWAWDGATWQQIQPVSTEPTLSLLPPYGLFIEDVTHEDIWISWQLPDQPDLVPTNVQYRVQELQGEVWTELGYPVTSYEDVFLDPETLYNFEVRLIVRTLGEITATSTIAAIEFTTLQMPVGHPAEDPGSPPGGSTIPIRPLPGGGPVGDPDTCWFTWELFIISQETLAWITTGITGTHPGDQEDFDFDLATLDPTRVYRFEFCEICDVDGVETPGECNFGPAFNGIGDWGADCGDIPPPPSFAQLPTADAIWAMPEICVLDGQQGIFDHISGTQLDEGRGFLLAMTDQEGEHAILANSLGGVVFTAGLAVIETAIQPGQDFTVMYNWRHTDAELDEGTFAEVAIGISHVLQRVITATGWAAQAQFSKAGGGFLTLTSPEYPFDNDRHTIGLRWDDDGAKDLFVDGTGVDTDTTGVGLGTTILNSYVAGIPADAQTRAHFGWARLLTDWEIGQMASPGTLGWWGRMFEGGVTYPASIVDTGEIMLAGAEGSAAGGVFVGTVAPGEYVVSIGQGASTSDTGTNVILTESWGFGGWGGLFANYGGVSAYTLQHGGGRTELRTGASRTTAVLIAPGGGGSPSGGVGGFPDGLPAVSTGGGFSGYTGTGGTASTYGLGGEGYANSNDGKNGDAGEGGSGVGSGGAGGNGSVSFGDGGAGGGGGGGKHGGGGGSGGNGSFDAGRGGGGGSGDTSGAATTVRTVNGGNAGSGMAAYRTLSNYSDRSSDFINAAPGLRSYIPCEETGAKIVVNELISGKGFWDRRAAIIFDGTIGSAHVEVQTGVEVQGRGAAHVSRMAAHENVDFRMRATDATDFWWNPPTLNAGQSWAIEWTQQVVAGAAAEGPGAISATVLGSYPTPAVNSNIPWRVSAASTTTMMIQMATTALTTSVTLTSPAMAVRDVTLPTRYCVSYYAATDTFHFHRSDGATSSKTRTAGGMPVTGQWDLQTWQPALFCSIIGNNHSYIQDVAVFDIHRTPEAFMATAAPLMNLFVAGTSPATGGTITTRLGYTYHTFTSNGTFDPTSLAPLTCDVMAIGGGGGGGGGKSGVAYNAGGASGQMEVWESQVISAPVAITIGSGGAQAPGTELPGTDGGSTIVAGIGTVVGGEAGGTDGFGEGGDNVAYPGGNAPSTLAGGGGGTGGPSVDEEGGIGREWPEDSGEIWGCGGGGGSGYPVQYGNRGAGSGAGGQGNGNGLSGRVMIRYLTP